MFLLKILDASLNGDMWIVYILPEGERFAVPKAIPASNNPSVCPGGIWCKDFGCEEGVNNFTKAEPVILGGSELDDESAGWIITKEE